jgi:hypothetical protein
MAHSGLRVGSATDGVIAHYVFDHLAEFDRHTKPVRGRVPVRLDRAFLPVTSDRKSAVTIVTDGASPQPAVRIGAFDHLGEKPLELHGMNHRINDQRLGDEGGNHRSPNADSQPGVGPPHLAAPGAGHVAPDPDQPPDGHHTDPPLSPLVLQLSEAHRQRQAH